MNDERPSRHRGRPGDVASEILHDVGDELAAVVSVPGELTYRTLNKFFSFIGDSSILLAQTLGFIFRGAVNVRDMFSQMAFIGVASLPIVLITVSFSGAVLSLYMAQIVVKWGFGSFTGGVVGLSIAREIGPVLTSVVVAARAGSAIGAEIGSMKVTEQIDALRSLAVSPVQYLVVPRLLAGIVMLPVLTVFADVGIWAGYSVAVVNGVAAGGYIDSLKSQVLPYDVIMGLVKTLFFGTVIVITGAQQGLRTTGGATGVGNATTNSVVISIVIIYILNFFLAYVMFGGKTAFL